MANTYLTRTQGSTGSETKGTFSAWVKRSGLTTASNMYTSYQADNEFCDIQFNSSDQLQVVVKIGGTDYLDLRTTRLFRDVSAFYHIVVVFDSTDSTQADRCKLYVNGTRETSFATNTNNVSSSLNMRINGSSQDPYIGSWHNQGNYFDGSMTHIHWIDGTAYDASTFAESDSVSGIWKPKTAPSVTYGTNGFFLKMENSGAMGTDSSGNSNTFTVSGTLTQNVDTPSNNFATFNPLFDAYSSSISFNNGNLRLDQDASGWGTAVSSLAANTGKWYAEFKATSITSNGMLVGIVEDGYANNLHYVGVAGTIGYHYNGEIYNRDSNTSFGNSYAQGDIIGVAMDLTNGYVYFSKNGTFQNSGVPTSGATGTGGISIGGTTGSNYFFGLSINASGYHGEANFGQGYFGTTAVASAGTAPSEGGIFEYDCPSGYQALSTKGINSF